MPAEDAEHRVLVLRPQEAPQIVGLDDDTALGEPLASQLGLAEIRTLGIEPDAGSRHEDRRTSEIRQHILIAGAVGAPGEENLRLPALDREDDLFQGAG